jgi:hypothetical protein
METDQMECIKEGWKGFRSASSPNPSLQWKSLELSRRDVVLRSGLRKEMHWDNEKVEWIWLRGDDYKDVAARKLKSGRVISQRK